MGTLSPSYCFRGYPVHAFLAAAAFPLLLTLLFAPTIPVVEGHRGSGPDGWLDFADDGAATTTTATTNTATAAAEDTAFVHRCGFDDMMAQERNRTDGQTAMADATLASEAELEQWQREDGSDLDVVLTDEVNNVSYIANYNGNSDIYKTTTTNTAGAGVSATSTRATSRSGYTGIRIAAFTADLSSPSYYCSAVGQRRYMYDGNYAYCQAEDVLTQLKRNILVQRMLPYAARMHQDRLLVRAMRTVTVASVANSVYCRSFHHPTALPYTVSNRDFIMLVAAAPTQAGLIAWAAPCSSMWTGRPVLGVVNISPRYISNSVSTMRVLAHEITHALGFMDDIFAARGMRVNIRSLRGKTSLPVIASSAVVAQARLQFGCQTLSAVELEDTGGGATASSHWKMRNLKDELMSPVTGALIYSAITIAAMEDTGFFLGNYANAEVMAYGHQVGCGPIVYPCINPFTGKSNFPSMFCDNTYTNVCSEDRLGLGFCNIEQHRSAIPGYAQYFGSNAIGGAYPAMDYCPFLAKYTNGGCEDGDAGVLKGSLLGVDSRCLTSVFPAGVEVAGKGTIGGICASIQCYKKSQSYLVKFAGMSTYLACPAGSIVYPSLYSGTFRSGAVQCPTYREVCGGNVVYDAYAPSVPAFTTPAPATTQAPQTPAPTATTTTTTTTTTTPTATTEDPNWMALGRDPVNFKAFHCSRDGFVWTQYNRCTHTSAAADGEGGNSTNAAVCYGDHVTLDGGATVYSASAGYAPCQLSACAGYSCASNSSSYVLVQRYTPLEVTRPREYNVLPATEGCYCVPVRADGLPDTRVDPEETKDELRVSPGGDGYREDDSTCLASGYVCPDNATTNLDKRRGRCYCCSHRNQPGYFASFSTCFSAERK